MNNTNNMTLKFQSYIENENFARLAVASFCSIKIKDLDVLSDIKTAVSEAITNCIVHAYERNIGDIEIECLLSDCDVSISITDYGIGINNLEEAKKPFYTSKPDKERSGMGFTVMEGFMDKVTINTEIGKGTKVILYKKYIN